MKRTQIVIVGEYSRTGYTVGTNDGKELYSASNSSFDSTTVYDTGDLDALSLCEIRRLCIQATRDIAAEWNKKYGGVQRIEQE